MMDFIDAGAIPALELSMRFASRRQHLIAHNIANIETPDFRQEDVSVAGFRKVLSEAVDRRRAAGVDDGPMAWQESDEIRHARRGDLALRPRSSAGGVLFHDRNNRDLERLMQDLTENASAFRVASDLLRTRFDVLKMAISQRV